MDLKPSPETLEQIATRTAESISRQEAQDKAAAEREKRLKKIAKVRPFVDTLDKKAPESDRLYKTSAWVDVRKDEETGVTLQVAIGHEYTPKDWRDPDYRIDMHDHKTLVTRFVDSAGVPSELTEVVSIRRSEQNHWLQVNPVMGLKGGRIDLKGVNDIKNSVVNQVHEIQQELLDPFLAAQQGN